jgi:hypothetical protein
MQIDWEALENKVANTLEGWDNSNPKNNHLEIKEHVLLVEAMENAKIIVKLFREALDKSE